MVLKTSFITPVYNAKYVTKTMDSVFNQTTKPTEYCLCVDGKEESLPIVLNYFKEKNCSIFKQDDIYETVYRDVKVKIKFRAENRGIGATLNDCIMLSEGDLIFWLSADDQAPPDRLEISLNEWEKLLCPKDQIIYGDYTLLDLKSNNVYHRVNGIKFKSLEEEKVYVINSCFVNFSTTLIPREVFKKVGLFCSEKRFGEDFEWLMRAIVIGEIFVHHIPIVLVHYGVDVEVQETHNKKDLIYPNDLDSKKRVLALLEAKKKGELENAKYFPELKDGN